ncbi:hypothetical protein ACWN8V_06845 [Vagococcus elongatus]|uniref:Uncharacterized protein n=1 Tax=Vagococcus elongatus TaxID=180344 RepID=A0A430AW19_9ENTE|nr:hypothetical protein [Vagococcus elongatus]RSU12251.1 hypothetical protein CBF29_06535 [Vagococcus elongatus]
MNLQKTIQAFLRKNDHTIRCSVVDFDKKSIDEMYAKLFNAVDYRFSWSDVLQITLSETMRIVDEVKRWKITDETYLKFASVMLEVSESNEFDSVELLYSLVTRSALEGENKV